MRVAPAAAVALAVLAGGAGAWVLRGAGGEASALAELRRRLDEEREARGRLEEQLAHLQADVLALRVGADVVSEADVAPYLRAEKGAAGAEDADAEHAKIAADAAERGPPATPGSTPRASPPRASPSATSRTCAASTRRWSSSGSISRTRRRASTGTADTWPRSSTPSTSARARCARATATTPTTGSSTPRTAATASSSRACSAAPPPTRRACAPATSSSATTASASSSPARWCAAPSRAASTRTSRSRVLRGGATRTFSLPRGPLGIRLGRDTVQPSPIP